MIPFHLIDLFIYGGIALIVAAEYVVIKKQDASPPRTEEINVIPSIDAE